MSDDILTDEFLAHYGVKGMKWGHRKAGTGEPSSRKAAKADGKADKAAAKAAAKTARKAGRREIAKNLNSEFDLRTAEGKTRTGLTVASTILVGPATNIYMGAKIAQASGFSWGESAAVGLIGGAPGALAVAEISVRAKARKR